jgi:hypothetical protein
MKASGSKVTSDVPLTTPASFAHATASENHSPAGTSSKPLGTVGTGDPSRRIRRVHGIDRFPGQSSDRYRGDNGGRRADVPAWLYAGGITALFTVVINAIALRSVKKLKLTDLDA